MSLMNCSPELGEIGQALAKAQAEIVAARKDATNPFFKSKYATLDSVWNACRTPLTKNGLSIVQVPMTDENGMVLITRLLHSSGQWIESQMAVIPAKGDIQSLGSTLTYIRRYSLSAMVGVTPDEDDDGNAGSETAPQKKEPKQQPKPAPKVNKQSAWTKFLARCHNELSLDEDAVRTTLKECGYNGFNPEQSSEMFKHLKDKVLPAPPDDADQKPLFPDEPAIEANGAYQA